MCTLLTRFFTFARYHYYYYRTWNLTQKGNILFIRVIWGIETHLQPFLTLTPQGDVWLLSWAGHFSPNETAPHIQWIGNFVGLSAGKDFSRREKSLFPMGFEYRIVHAVNYLCTNHSGTIKRRYVLIKGRMTGVWQSVGTEVVVAFPTLPRSALVPTWPPIRLVTEALFWS